jgi:hypothetical protein
VMRGFGMNRHVCEREKRDETEGKQHIFTLIGGCAFYPQPSFVGVPRTVVSTRTVIIIFWLEPHNAQLTTTSYYAWAKLDVFGHLCRFLSDFLQIPVPQSDE